ncbi:MAG: polysaccharide biosynthesis C-terminal domain-containing protein [Bacteroidales bacterium]|nr:polysaccharide biosynthesis C-terminal domain-containing protein [Bacteroidales bacterium]
MKQKDFIFNIGLLIFLNLLVKPIWILGIDVGVQNSVGAASYGLYFAVFNFTFLFNMLLDMGITNFNNRNIAQNAQLLAKHLSGIIALRFLLGGFYMALIFIVSLIIGYSGFQLQLLFWVALNQFLSSFILYLRSNISALLMFKTDSFISVLDRLIMILLCGILLWGNVTTQPFKIEWFVYCQTAAYLIVFLITGVIVLCKARPLKLYWNITFYRMIIKKSFPYAILFLLMSFYCRIDSVMIERLLPNEISTFQVGIYAAAFRLLDALVMIAYLFSVILLPLFAKMLKNKEQIEPIIKSSFSILYFFSITATILLVKYRYPILNLLYDDHIEEIAAIFQLLFPCLIPMSFTYIFGTLLTANGNMRLLNITAIAGIILNMCLNLILIPHMKAEGAAIASLSTQGIISIIQIIIVFCELKISLNTLPYLRCIGFTVLFIAGEWLLFKYVTLNFWPHIALSCITAILLALSTRLIRISTLINQHS